MARYAIGDVQGCMASLERLLSLIDYAPSRDHLWFVGDLVNRGPRSLDVLRWAYAHDAGITCVLGNHDLHLLARVAEAVEAKPRDTLDELLAAPDRDRLVDWLRARPLLVRDDAYLLVHAGLHPSWTAADARGLAAEIEHELQAPTWRAFVAQVSIGASGAGAGASGTGASGRKNPPPRWDPRLGGGDRWRAILAYLLRVRMCRLDGRVVSDFDDHPSKAPAGCVPWFALPDRQWAKTHTAVFGHWAALGLDIGPRHLALDTGCVWGKSLTAFRLDDRMVFQAKAVEAAS